MIRLQDLAASVGGRVAGDGDIRISGIAGITEAGEGDITFLSHAGFRKHLKDCKASAVIVGEDVEARDIEGKNVVVVKNPALAYAAVANMFAEHAPRQKGISESAFVAKGAKVGEEASIAPYVHIEDGATIDGGVTLYPFVYIGRNVAIGKGTTIYPNVTIYDGVTIGRDVVIHGGTVIGSDGFGYIWDGKKHVKIPQLEG